MGGNGGDDGEEVGEEMNEWTITEWVIGLVEGGQKNLRNLRLIL